ncbi:hypothetical protein CASFOL_002948 [Castilleja foliolosa]|uniref:Telomerase reverse transcriptase n=1 Tax=Castilleja foliolosa TaxID=1961234 RepID=A0ABD3EFT6_9LAMI
MARKRERVPEVLWRLFRSRARTLADTILALIPPPPPLEMGAQCRCRGRRCLSCCEGDAMSFLLRPGDPADYRKLLTGCFVVVSENAPLPPSVFDPHCRWSQREIVRRSIELIMQEQPSSSNLICCSYDEDNRSSDAVETLTSSKWTVLLKRVGDAMMMYLLKHTSLFLPLPRKKFHQISGFPISDLSCKISRRGPGSKTQLFSHVHDGSRKKRKKVEGVESQLGKEPSSNPIRFPECNGENKCEGGLKQDTFSSKKRTRQYRWQRHRKRRQLVAQENHDLVLCEGKGCNSDDLSSGLPNCVGKNHEGNLCRCICCSVFLKEPKTDILYTVKPNDSGASVLFNNIFRPFGIEKNLGTIPCLHSKINHPVISTCLYHSLTKLLKNLIRETQNCRYLRLLDKHCPIGTSHQDACRVTSSGFEVEPSKCHCPKKQVVSFIWAICRRIIPSPLLGEPSNWRVLRKNISKFIHLRKFEKFSLKESIYKLKISKYPLLSNKYCGDTARHAIFQCWIYWFFAFIVSPLVHSNFYVTETENGKQEVLYFRKSTWEKLITKAECMKNGMYCQLDHALTEKIVKNRLFGFSRARLRPKQSGFRMLTNLQAPSRMRVDPISRTHSTQKLPSNTICNHRRVKYRFFKSVNSVLHDLHVVIKGLRTKEPEKLGSSVFDYNDVYRKMVPFLCLLRNGSSDVMPSVYIVVSDVSKAFDSVNQDKLLSVMMDVVLDNVYTLEKFTQVICTKKALKVHQHTALACHDIIATSAKITHRLPVQTLDCVLIKKELSRNITKDEIILILEEHITRNVVQLHSNFYLQNVGIPQGSVLSSLLCSYYYGHMERNVIFPFLEKDTKNQLGKFDTSAEKVVPSGPVYLLLRFIDDFIFISTSKKQASMFFSRLARGVRDYNCCMNEEKYGLNFDLNNGQECPSNRLCVGKDGGSYLRWSGLLVNCSTLEIQADYTRYLNSHLSSTLTVSCRGKVGRQLKAKLRCYLRPKCHPIFYDSNINSPQVVRLNIYQVFLLCAMKFICYIKCLSILPSFSPNFYFNTIDSSLRYMNRLIKRKMYSFNIEPSFRPKYNVKKKDIIWLGLYAYSRVVEKKQSRYKELLRLLRLKLKGYWKVKNMSSELKYAVDDAHSSVLWSIKY